METVDTLDTGVLLLSDDEGAARLSELVVGSSDVIAAAVWGKLLMNMSMKT